MNPTLFITIGISVCLFGTLLGSLCALLGRKHHFQRIAQIIMMIAFFSGAASAATFLLKDLPALQILNNTLFSPGGLIIDRLSAVFFFLVNMVSFWTILYAFKYILHEKGHYNLGYIQFLSAFFIFGMQMITLATTPVFFFFMWEIMSFSSFLLVMADFKITSVRPALFYLIMTHLGAGAILLGFLLLSGGSLTIHFNALAVIASTLSPGTILVSFLLFFFGFGSKAGLFPFHGWLPEAHPQAPSPISALMSGVMLKIAVYGFIRIVFFILPPLPLEIGFLVVSIGLFSALFGVFYSIIETDIKRILAFSSIENLGLIFSMLGLSIVAKTSHMDSFAEISLIAALFQSICHSFFKSGLFLSAGIAGQVFHTRNIEKMGGIAKKMRVFSFAVLLLCLTAAALPPSGAFIGEWLVIQSIITLITGALFPIKVLLLFTLISFVLVAGMAVFSMVRFFGIAFLAAPRSPDADIASDPVREMLLPILILSASGFLLGGIFQFFKKNLTPNSTLLHSTPSFAPLTFNPILLFLLLLGVIFLAFLFRRLASKIKNERLYHTWDCGQPIDASMEYTGTAFSAPIRFFFGTLLRADKKIIARPLVSSNPWLVKKTIHIEIKPLWDQFFYNPIVRLVKGASMTIRRLQNGNIQFYITLILLSLILTAIISL